MRVRVLPASIAGDLKGSPSKSAAHRALICAALCKEETCITLPQTNADIERTMEGLIALGASIKRQGDDLLMEPCCAHRRRAVPLIACGESGSTLRFLLPLAAALGGASFTGEGRLPQRPLEDLVNQMKDHGVVFSSDTMPFTLRGGLRGGSFEIPGSVSSQYISGLLMAAPLLKEEVRLKVVGKMESAAYVGMTLDAMKAFHVDIEQADNTFVCREGQDYRSDGRYFVEADWSSAAFPLALGALRGRVSVTGMNMKSAQADRVIVELLKRMGARVTIEGQALTVEQAGRLVALDADVSECPDLVPVLAALLMHAEGKSCLYNAGRLRLKESDRLVTTCNLVNDLGGKAEIKEDRLEIEGVSFAPGGTVCGENDHRIVMAAAVAATACHGESVITDAQAVGKSYPSFFDEMNQIGGKAYVDELRA